MKDNHYTPDPEEFCSGFEFEAENYIEYDEEAKEPVYGWVKYKFEDINPEGHDRIEDAIKSVAKVCIVKHLDREDIESLGFTFLPKESLGDLNWRFKIEQHLERIDRSEGGDDTMWWNVHLKYYPDRRRIFINGDISDGSKDEKFFEGEVRNKSELKRILKQIGI